MRIDRRAQAAEFEALKHVVACILLHHGDHETLVDVIDRAREQTHEQMHKTTVERLAYRRVFDFFLQFADPTTDPDTAIRDDLGEVEELPPRGPKK